MKRAGLVTAGLMLAATTAAMTITGAVSASAADGAIAAVRDSGQGSTGVVPAMPGETTPNATPPGGTRSGEYADTPVVRQLQALVGSQSDTEIATIIGSGELVQVLMDDAGTAIAAMYDEARANRFLAA